MKRLVVSLAVLGLVAGPASAHKAEGVKCRARIIRVTQENGNQTVRTKVSIENVSKQTFESPVLVAGIYDADDDLLAKVRLDAWEMRKDEAESQWNVVEVSPNADVDRIRVLHCHA